MTKRRGDARPQARRWRTWGLAAGLGVAAVYTLTPLTVCVLVAAAVVLPPFAGQLPPGERRWLTAIVAAAILARVIAIGAIFLLNLPNHDDQFVGATSGDESYGMSRALRTREIVRGATTDKYDYFVAYDEYGRNSYVSALTGAQVIFGPTPYAARLFNALLFTVAALLLFRVCRQAFGPLPSLGALGVVLFWPSLFAWSISLLKESLYFFLGTVILTGTVAVLRGRTRWRRALALLGAAAAAALVKDLRPAALLLLGAGLAAGLGGSWVAGSRRAAIAAIAAGAALAAVLSLGSGGPRLMRGLEAAAKTHSGHVFTVGHAYKLLDAGFYVNPQAPSSSTLTLTPAEAGRFVVRALKSFIVVPVPWELQSRRELAYLPEQMAWYTLILLLPIGVAAGLQRDRLVTCMLVGYSVPTAMALALTNGNVGTLLRLRGLVTPYLVWIGAVGFCAGLAALGRKDHMPFIDDDGRLFGRINLFDAAVAAFLVGLLPAAYGTFLLFRTPAPQIASVTSVPITREERRVAGGSRLTAKLKIRGNGLRPMLSASIGETPTLGFVFENPNSADVLVGDVPPGTHDLVLRDGVQEVARLPRSVTIESSTPPRVSAVGTLLHLSRTMAEALTPGALSPGGPKDAMAKVGEVRPEGGDLWQRSAEIILQCDPDPNVEGCAVGGILLTTRPLPTVKVVGPAGQDLSFALSEVFPQAPPRVVVAEVRLASAPELLNLVRTGDRDDCLDERAATIEAVRARRAGAAGVTELDVTLRLGVDQSPEGWRYRGRLFRAGAPFTLTTERYVMEGRVLKTAGPLGNEAK